MVNHNLQFEEHSHHIFDDINLENLLMAPDNLNLYMSDHSKYSKRQDAENNYSGLSKHSLDLACSIFPDITEINRDRENKPEYFISKKRASGGADRAPSRRKIPKANDVKSRISIRGNSTDLPPRTPARLPQKKSSDSDSYDMAFHNLTSSLKRSQAPRPWSKGINSVHAYLFSAKETCSVLPSWTALEEVRSKSSTV